MKELIISDLHFGANQNDLVYFEYQKNIINSWLIPLCKQKEVVNIKILGDFFDNKKLLNVYIIDEIDKIFETNQSIKWEILAGNHDLYYSNSDKVSSIDIFKKHPNVDIIRKMKIENNTMTVPWLNTEEQWSEFKNNISKHNIINLFGHFEFIGFQMMEGVTIEKGLSHKELSNIPNVISGHIHLPQIQDNTTYVGPPWDINWSDAKSIKGCLIFDHVTKTYERIDHNLKFYQHVKVTMDNYKSVIQNISNNPNRRFKLSLDEEIPEFLNYIEKEYEFPENIKSCTIKNDKNNEDNNEENIDNNLSTNELLHEYIDKKLQFPDITNEEAIQKNKKLVKQFIAKIASE